MPVPRRFVADAPAPSARPQYRSEILFVLVCALLAVGTVVAQRALAPAAWGPQSELAALD